MTSVSRKPNRLLQEKSPYLLQHAYNPVDWYPWGEEAFELARLDDKPIFLSIGYSTCYWCHVMEREVFENDAIAGLMNERLVCIKVDREERPDVDHIYMTAVQMMTGSGGWPMSVFLTPDRKPFFGGTYFPPRPAHGRPSFPQLVERISDLWKNERAKLLDSAEYLTGIIAGSETATASEQVTTEIPQRAFESSSRNFDRLNGGFGGAPKFPRPATLEFLLRYHYRTGDTDALSMVRETLAAMDRGGIHDHLGGGFHRYATDASWNVPHFEKMLYDQAQLVTVYLAGYQLTGDASFAAAARDILQYVSTNLTSPAGAFYSAEDAESVVDPSAGNEKEEGAFYLWTVGEVRSLLSAAEFEMFCFHYGIREAGNAEPDPMQVFRGKNILRVEHSIEETARRFNTDIGKAESALANARSTLRQQREKRPRPHLDDKIITGWNGLMISAFARAAQVLGEDSYAKQAETAAEFIMSTLYRDGRLYRRHRDGDTRFDATLQDYAFLIAGLLDLYETTFRTRWLKDAIAVTEIQISLFRDPDRHVFYDTSGTDASLIARTREAYDGAEPSGNSAAAMNFLRLGTMLARPEWIELGREILSSTLPSMTKIPEALPTMLCAAEWLLCDPMEIIIAGDAGAADTRALVEARRSIFAPHSVTLCADQGAEGEFLRSLLPFIRGMKQHGGRAAAYVCRNFSCQLPVTAASALRELLILR